MSSTRASGNSVFTSAGEISCTSTPHQRLKAATRRYSSRRSASAATSMKPTGLNPVAWPVSASSRAIEIAGVFPQLGRRLGGGAESDDQPGRVPRRARGEPIALQQHDVLPAHVRQVIGDRRPDDAAAHHNHTCAIRQHRSSHRQNPRSGGQFTCILSTLKRNRRPFALCRYPSARDRSREANILRGMASPSRQVKGAERR